MDNKTNHGQLIPSKQKIPSKSTISKLMFKKSISMFFCFKSKTTPLDNLKKKSLSERQHLIHHLTKQNYRI